MRPSQFRAFVVACFTILLLHGCAQTNHTHAAISISPAYRPASENATAFMNDLKTTTIAVYPSIIRSPEKTSYSPESQQQVISLLNEKQVATTLAVTETIDPGTLQGESQWQMFQNDLHNIAENLKTRKSGAQYSLVMEVLFPPGNQSIFGIHCYVYDQQGNNVFSFLLNSHHRLFIDANLNAKDASQASRAILLEKATRVGVDALIQQVNTPQQEESIDQSGYSITSSTVEGFDRKVEKVFVISRLQERLIPVFMHSFKHSLASAFESNGVETVIKFISRDSSDLAKFDSDIEKFKPDAVMHIELDPLYRTRKDGYQAIVGTDFQVNAINRASGEGVWKASGKVDYIRMFGPGYSAHEGIRKEFAWHTTAAMVRTFIFDVNGHKSAPIYTVTEDRELYRQRTD